MPAKTPAQSATTSAPHTEPAVERVIDIDVSDEMASSFLEYAYSVIYSRALPDARDGLKPVQRRILFQMSQMGLRPDRGHVKCARVVGEVMGRLHPHGDSAIYDALVRLAQPFALRLPFVDGHGNFGSLDDGPAAMRYTECRLAPAASTLTESLDEDVVDFLPNYDGREHEPAVLPAAMPTLLVNGAAGIAVGMATNMAPHNVGEVCAAAALLLERNDVTLDDVMALVPGPDFPTGGQLVGRSGVREAYETGRGSFRLRASTRIEQVSPRRQGIVVTALPFNVGPERVIERIKDLVRQRKIDGIADLIDLTDGESGLHLVIEIKSGFSAEAVRELLLRLTPLEETFAINNVALVDGQPRTLGLLELLRVFVEHRVNVVRRRCMFRRTKAQQRLHLVAGLLIAVLDIDEVVALIRSSDDAAVARRRLIEVFDLSEVQAGHILDMPLRRLTKYSQLELATERDELTATISELSKILDSEAVLRSSVRDELIATSAAFDTPRRTELVDGPAQRPNLPKALPGHLEVADAPCVVELAVDGLLRRDPGTLSPLGNCTAGPLLNCVVQTTARAEVGLITSSGVLHRLAVADLPAAPASNPVSEYVALRSGETPVGLVAIGDVACEIAIGTASGVVKRTVTEGPKGKSEWEIISLKPGDRVIGAGAAPDGADLIFVTSDAQLLRFEAAKVRPQGRTAGGMVGVNLSAGARAICFAIAAAGNPGAPVAVVVTVAGSMAHLAGTGPTSIKASALEDFPRKGRGTGGVRCHRLVKGEDSLLLAAIGPAVGAQSSAGQPVTIPGLSRRDASGNKATSTVVALGTLGRSAE